MQVTVVFLPCKCLLSLLKAVCGSEFTHSSCVFFPPLNPVVTLASCPSFASGFFLLCEDTSTLFTSLPSPVHRGSLAGIHSFWCSYIPEEMQPMFLLSFS